MDFQNSGSTSTTLNVLSFCSNKTSSPDSDVPLVQSFQLGENNTELHNVVTSDVHTSLQISYGSPWLDVESMKDCGKQFNLFKHVTRDYRGYRDLAEQTTERFVSRIFINGTYNYSAYINHTKCIALETEVLQLIQKPLVRAKDAWEIYVNLTTAETIQEALVYAEKLAGYYGDAVNNELIRYEYDNRMTEQCKWLEEFVWEEVYRVPWSKKTAGKEIRIFMRKILNTMRREYKKMFENYMTIIFPRLENLGWYLNGNMSKTELSENLGKISFIKSAEALYGQNADIRSSIKDFITEMILAKENLLGLYSTLVSLKLPILNTHNIYELDLVKQAGALDDPRLQHIVDSLKSDVTHLPELVEECYDRLIRSMEEVIAGLVKPVEDVLEQIDELRNYLKIYQTSTRMDTDFFM